MVPSGRAVTNPAELLQKPALQEFVESVVDEFDWVIFDSPPLNLFADAQRLSQVCDAALLVFRDGVTPREAPEQCMTALEGRFIAGIVLNASNDPGESYYTDYRGLEDASCWRLVEFEKAGLGALILFLSDDQAV